MSSSADSAKAAPRASAESPLPVVEDTSAGAGTVVGGSAKQRRRKRISDVATMLFRERGFDAVSIAEIAEAAGVSKMTVTNHFALKEDLIFDELDDEVELIREAMAGVDGVAAAVDAIERYCEQRELQGGLARALALEQVPDAWPAFARMVLASRALTQRFHVHYLDVRDAIVAGLPDSVSPDEATTASWLLAETVHLVDWWPFEAVERGMSTRRIRSGRTALRARAFAALRTGLLRTPPKP